MPDDGGRKLWAAGVWFFGLLGLIAVLVTDKKTDKELKFYGIQAVLLGVAFFIVNIVLGILGGIFSLMPVLDIIGNLLLLFVTVALMPIYVIIFLYGLWKAYSLVHFKLPVIGNFAEQWSGKI